MPPSDIQHYYRAALAYLQTSPRGRSGRPLFRDYATLPSEHLVRSRGQVTGVKRFGPHNPRVHATTAHRVGAGVEAYVDRVEKYLTDRARPVGPDPTAYNASSSNANSDATSRPAALRKLRKRLLQTQQERLQSYASTAHAWPALQQNAVAYRGERRGASVKVGDVYAYPTLFSVHTSSKVADTFGKYVWHIEFARGTRLVPMDRYRQPNRQWNGELRSFPCELTVTRVARRTGGGRANVRMTDIYATARPLRVRADKNTLRIRRTPSPRPSPRRQRSNLVNLTGATSSSGTINLT